jgi:hypothetical protein
MIFTLWDFALDVSVSSKYKNYVIKTVSKWYMKMICISFLDHPLFVKDNNPNSVALTVNDVKPN